MNYDKVNKDGTIEKAIPFTYRVLNSVTVLFELAEWMIVIAAFQYAGERFNSLPARVVSVILNIAFAGYLGVLLSNVAWREIDSIYATRRRRNTANFVLVLLSASLAFGLYRVIGAMVKAH